MYMKILFWILTICSILAGLFMSFCCYLMYGIDLYCTIIGKVVSIAGMAAVIVSVIGTVLGLILLRKGKVKKAVISALTGIVYSGIIFAGIVIDDAADTMMMEKEIAERKEQMYGEHWNDPPAMEGIPGLYQEVLNEFYIVIRDRWSGDQLMDLGAVTMYDYYGDASLDRIGFCLTDVNGDGSKELLIGTTDPGEESGTAIFCMYSDPDNPFQNLSSTEDEMYYLHAGETAGTCMAEIGGADAAWLLEAEDGERIVNISYQEGAMDPAGRMMLEMIPFSAYK